LNVNLNQEGLVLLREELLVLLIIISGSWKNILNYKIKYRGVA